MKNTLRPLFIFVTFSLVITIACKKTAATVEIDENYVAENYTK